MLFRSKMLLAGQKSGIVFALDPAKRGEILWQTRIGKGGTNGGIEWGMATDGDVVYACVPGKLWSDSAERGVYRTQDGGASWQLVLRGANLSTGCSGLSLDPKNPNVVFAGLWDFRRKGWTFRSGGESPEAASGSGLYRSSDGGTSWQELSGKGLPAKPWGRVEVAVAPSDPKVVYAFVESKDSGLYRSSDGGEFRTELVGPHRAESAETAQRPGTHPSHGRIGRGASAVSPRTTLAQRTAITLRRAGDAHRRAEVEHGLVPGPAGPLRHGRIGQSLYLGPAQPSSRPAGQHPGHVGVDHGDVGLEGERQHRPGRVRPDPGQGQQRLEPVGHDPAVVGDDGRSEEHHV